ncbi:MAG TPA: hypothetical protein VMT03_22185 [Polyangia bacterium]|nr:hypothetical protein [Polyangia bacterium]
MRLRLLLPALLVLAACGSGGHAGSGGGGAGGRPFSMANLLPDAQEGDAAADADAAGDAVDAEPTFSCQLAVEAGAPTACIQVDDGYPDPATLCADLGAGPVINSACPRDDSAGGCHQVERSDAAISGYTTWWYAPLGLGTVLARCEQMGASYVSP